MITGKEQKHIVAERFVGISQLKPTSPSQVPHNPIQSRFSDISFAAQYKMTKPKLIIKTISIINVLNISVRPIFNLSSI